MERPPPGPAPEEVHAPAPTAWRPERVRASLHPRRLSPGRRLRPAPASGRQLPGCPDSLLFKAASRLLGDCHAGAGAGWEWGGRVSEEEAAQEASGPRLWSHAHGHVTACQLMPETKQVRFQCHAPDQECREFHTSNGWARLPRTWPRRSGACPARCPPATRGRLPETRWPSWGLPQPGGRLRPASGHRWAQLAIRDTTAPTPRGSGPQHVSRTAPPSKSGPGRTPHARPLACPSTPRAGLGVGDPQAIC